LGAAEDLPVKLALVLPAIHASEARWQIASTAPVERLAPNRSRVSSQIPRREIRYPAVSVTIAACILGPNGEAPIASGSRALVRARQYRQRN